MIVFSLRRFKGGEGRFVVVDELHEPEVGEVALFGRLCAAAGQLLTSRPDENMAFYSMVEIDDLSRLEPTTPEAKAWLAKRVAAQNGTR